jgi:hypothetical protein
MDQSSFRNSIFYLTTEVEPVSETCLNKKEGLEKTYINTRVAQKVMSHFFFLGKYIFRMYEIDAQYNWMCPVHMLFFHIISIYVYDLTPALNTGMHAFPAPARFLFA